MNTSFSAKIRLFLIYLLIGCIFVGGFFLRIADSSDSIWLDEAFSIHVAEQSIISIPGILSTDNAAPLYFFLLHAWIRIVGSGEIAVRFLSVIISWCILPFFWYTAQPFLGRKKALIALIFLATHPLLVLYAQEARPYALAQMLTLLSTILFFSCIGKDFRSFTDIEQPPSRNVLVSMKWLCLGFCNLTLFLTHYWAFTIICAQYSILGMLIAKPYLRVISKKALKKFCLLTKNKNLRAKKQQRDIDERSQQGVVKLFHTKQLFLIALSFIPFIVGTCLWSPILGKQLQTETLPWLVIEQPLFLFLRSFKAFTVSPLVGIIWVMLAIATFLRKKITTSTLLWGMTVSIPLLIAQGISFFTPFYMVGRYDTIVLPLFLVFLASLLGDSCVIVPRTFHPILVVTIMTFTIYNFSLGALRQIHEAKSADDVVAYSLLTSHPPGSLIIFTHLTRTPFEYYATHGFSSLPSGESGKHSLIQDFLDKLEYALSQLIKPSRIIVKHDLESENFPSLVSRHDARILKEATRLPHEAFIKEADELVRRCSEKLKTQKECVIVYFHDEQVNEKKKLNPILFDRFVRFLGKPEYALRIPERQRFYYETIYVYRNS